jgi:hypothetical protein
VPAPKKRQRVWPTTNRNSVDAVAGYRWARLDVDYLHNPKVRSVSPDARALHLASILYCCAQLTDGQIADRTLRDLAQTADIASRWSRRRASELEAARLWIPGEGGWTLHDFAAMNPQAMREIVERDRASSRERQARWRRWKIDGVTP